jgi:serine phosphatase RsbU (regulator of sigma subunit)/anti-sigma regulatory factor (Ser/Thr protein kinase)/TolA-binding protein
VFKAAINEEIKVPAQIDYLGDLRNFVTKAGRKHNFPATVVNAFKLCIDEAATNIIKHAYRDWEGMITLRVIVKKNSMTVVLIDQGKYFDPSRVADPDLNRYVDIGKKGGLGIFIMRKLLDEIDYHHTEEGNELRLTKYRESSFRKKQGAISTSTLSVSLKTKYSLMTAGILTLIVIAGYFFFFFVHGNNVFNEFVITEKVASEEVARIVIQGNDELNDLLISGIVNNYIKERKEIFRITITDENNRLVYTTDEELFIKFFNAEFEIPVPNEQIWPFLFRYKIDEKVAIYSFVTDILNNEYDRIKIGKIYLDVKKDYVGSKIAARRIKNLQVALFILLIGYAGTFVLVYFILNPFRKLATWVKELGSGDVKDEIDFDSSDEVGEIAQAFSEITDKFRESQKSLAEQERIQKEMQLAQDIQQTLLPAEVPDLEGYEIASYYEAAKEVGGDYFDFVQVDKDTLGIVVADVSGKGVPGSLVMTMIRTALRTEARSLKSASEVLARVNEFVVNDMKKGMFVTLFYVIVDSKKRRINYASAGHNPMILFRQGTKKTYYLNPRGFPVGISLPDPELFKNSIESDTIQLTEDDILLIYTDGITEAMNNGRELFSEERLLDAVRKYGNLPAQDFIDKLKDEIHSFAEGYEQNDDITVVAIKERSTPEKIELNRAQTAHQMILKGKIIRDACEEAGITTYAYYNKYKKIFEEEGIDAYSIDETVSVEAKHLSIEEKTKIYDIIKKHPEYGAKRISEELDSEIYGFTQINESRIYDELVRSRLNTRQLREAYIARSGKKKRMKPPGTPMLTLDGKIILSKDLEKFDSSIPKPPVRTEKRPVPEKPEITIESKKQQDIKLPKDPDDNFYLESLMTFPIEDLLKKQREPHEEKESQKEFVESIADDTAEEEELEAVEFLEDSEDESEDDELFVEKEPDEFALEEMAEETDDFGLEHEFSFRDIWDEQDVDLSEEEFEQEGIEDDVKIVKEEVTIDQKKNEEDLDSPIKSSVDIDDVLEGSEEDDISDDFGFEMLTDEMSFKNEIFFEGNSENGNGPTKDKNIKPSVTESFSEELISNNLQEEKEATGEAEIEEMKESIPITEIDEDDLLAEDEKYAVTDFSFSDLLEEIENDISFFDENNLDEDEMEYAYESESQAKDARSIQESQNLSKSEDGASRKTGADTSFKSQQHDRLREKHLILGLKFYQEHNYKLAVEQFLKVVKIYPDFKEAYSILGNAYYRNNQIEKAIKSYERVKQIDPFDADAYENTGVIFANIGKYEDAIKEWKTLLEFRPDRKDILKHIEKAEDLVDE